jgi:hypothetical protein
MATHAGTRRDSSFQIDAAVLFEGTEIRPSQSLERDANFKGGFVEGGNGEAGAVYADAVAEMAIRQDFGSIGDGECGASIFSLVIELGDDYGLSEGVHVRR